MCFSLASLAEQGGALQLGWLKALNESVWRCHRQRTSVQLLWLVEQLLHLLLALSQVIWQSASIMLCHWYIIIGSDAVLNGCSFDQDFVFGNYICIGSEDSQFLLLLSWIFRKICQSDSSREILLSLGSWKLYSLQQRKLLAFCSKEAWYTIQIYFIK